ncbi:hypothetical protein PLICRDRAFT_35424 [Plicaturopsis crispa FD-325 SS-3]|nr:hypothetical protein PLICRDRAFT_35424 [Plicaturopsis crispa FD-325 SS-3]
MGLSRSARIKILLAIDIFFFFVELIIGYAVGSLALVADSFHMLNDVMSLIVALYAIKLTAENSSDSRYSYGWHRAEILAALVNGVFLLALCFSISLEALQRFFSTPEISNPRLVVIVGAWGLASNIVGLFLFHEHGHAHDDHKPVSKPASIAEHHHSVGDVTPKQADHSRQSTSRSRSSSFSSLYGHPAATRASLVQVAQHMAHVRSPSPEGRERSSSYFGREEGDIPRTTSPSPQPVPNERSPLLSQEPEHTHTAEEPSHDAHDHGHSHAGSMNMRALVLHVLGDALGNVGVIATGLVIWLTSWSFKYYFDPVISLVITVIIFSSALPLVRSTAFILLQGVPTTISLDDVRTSILEVTGVLSVHELHVWQLSESKIVASVHVMASRKVDFMPIAANVRKALHHHGIHSSTIQPEYYHPAVSPPEENLMTSEDTSCLILCPPDAHCDPAENACCPPPSTDV